MANILRIVNKFLGVLGFHLSKNEKSKPNKLEHIESDGSAEISNLNLQVRNYAEKKFIFIGSNSVVEGNFIVPVDKFENGLSVLLVCVPEFPNPIFLIRLIEQFAVRPPLSNTVYNH